VNGTTGWRGGCGCEERPYFQMENAFLC